LKGGENKMNSKLILAIIVIIAIVGIVIVINKGSGNNVSTTPTSQPVANKPVDSNIEVTANGFSPDTVTIARGTRVVWMNKSGTTVTVNSADHPTHQVYKPLNLGEFANGSSVQLIFDTAGTYKYHNHLKPSQTGTIVVQ
jgi:plastocyanin